MLFGKCFVVREIVFYLPTETAVHSTLYATAVGMRHGTQIIFIPVAIITPESKINAIRAAEFQTGQNIHFAVERSNEFVRVVLATIGTVKLGNGVSQFLVTGWRQREHFYRFWRQLLDDRPKFGSHPRRKHTPEPMVKMRWRYPESSRIQSWFLC